VGHVRFNFLTPLIPPPGAPVVAGGGGRRRATALTPLREKRELPFFFPSLLRSFVLSFAFLENGYHPVLFKSFSLSVSHSLSLCLSLSLSLSLVLFSRTPNGGSFAHGNSSPRIDHLPGRALLGIISYVVVAHSRSDMRRIPWRTTWERRIGS